METKQKSFKQKAIDFYVKFTLISELETLVAQAKKENYKNWLTVYNISVVAGNLEYYTNVNTKLW